MYLLPLRVGRGLGETRRPGTPSSKRQLLSSPTYFLGGGHRSWSLPGGVSFSPFEVPIVLSCERAKVGEERGAEGC